MTRLLPVLFAALFAMPAAASDKPFERPVVVRVDVDPSGSVIGADAVGDLPEALAAVAETATRDVEFEPAQVNGRPAASRTHVVVQMRVGDLLSIQCAPIPCCSNSRLTAPPLSPPTRQTVRFGAPR